MQSVRRVTKRLEPFAHLLQDLPVFLAQEIYAHRDGLVFLAAYLATLAAIVIDVFFRGTPQ